MADEGVGRGPGGPPHISVRRVLYWIVPSLFCLILYFDGLRAWFQMDDFAWLGLYQRVHDWHSFLIAMFKPLAQGTIRPWSERGFFMLFSWWFGMDSLPFRIVVFATQCVNLVLLTIIARRLTGSSLAGFLAPLLWTVNSTIYQGLSWTAAYNQIMCAMFLLGAFLLFHQYTQTGDRRYYWWQWLVFLLGFGSNELNVVFPALAALYALCCARKYLAPTIPMFAVSFIYAVVHRMAAPPPASDIYKMYFDTNMFWALLRNVWRSLGAGRLTAEFNLAPAPWIALGVLVALGLAAFVIQQLRNRQWLVLFMAGWFLIVILPVLPLKNHDSDYYATIPSIGLAMTGAWALANAMGKRPAVRVLAVVLALGYAIPSGWIAWSYTRLNYVNAREGRNFLTRVAYAHKLHPDRTILLKGVTNNLYWTAYYGNPFRLFGLTSVYMTADTEANVVPFPEMDNVSQHFLAETVALDAIRKRRAVVYETVEGRLRAITPFYQGALATRDDLTEPKQVKPGLPLFEAQLGTGWYRAEGGYRWTGRQATLRMSGPNSVMGKWDGTPVLRAQGFCAAEHVQTAPLFLTVSVDGQRFAPSRIDKTNISFDFRYPLNAALMGKRSIEVGIDVDRTIRKLPDERELGVAITQFEVIP